MKTCFQIAECSLSYAKISKKWVNEQISDEFFNILSTFGKPYIQYRITILRV